MYVPSDEALKRIGPRLARAIASMTTDQRTLNAVALRDVASRSQIPDLRELLEAVADELEHRDDVIRTRELIMLGNAAAVVEEAAANLDTPT